MKKIFIYSVMVAALLLSAVSCNKPVSEKIVGQYHFKMSGNMECNCVSYDSLLNPFATIEGERFLLKAQTGTMNVIKADNDSYIVNMSVAMFGDEMSFKATLKDDILYLEKHNVVVRVVREGVSGVSNSLSGQSILLELSGQGKLYEDTFMFQITPAGSFYSNFEDYDWKCTVTTTHDIVCVADRL